MRIIFYLLLTGVFVQAQVQWTEVTGATGWFFETVPGTSTIYISNSEGIHATHDGGETWHLDDTVSSALLYNSSDPMIAYAINGSELFKTTDGGNSWFFHQPPQGAQRLAISDSSPNTLYASSDQFVQRSDDGGNSWTELPVPLNEYHHLAIAISNPDITYVSVLTDLDVYRTEDGGQTWEERSTGLPHQTGIGHIPEFSSKMWEQFGYVRIKDQVYKTENGGELWTLIWEGDGTEYISEIVVDPQNHNFLLFMHKGMLHISENGGASFTSEATNVQTVMYQLAFDHINNVLYGQSQQTLYRTLICRILSEIMVLYPGWPQERSIVDLIPEYDESCPK